MVTNVTMVVCRNKILSLFLWESGKSWLSWYHFFPLVKPCKKKNPTKLTTEQLPSQISFSSSNMVYLFLLVCFSLNPSITLQCKTVRLSTRATSIMRPSLLITFAENARVLFASAVDWDRVNKYYLVGFFFPEKHCFSWLFFTVGLGILIYSPLLQ